MALSSGDTRVIREAEALLESQDINELQEALIKLLGAYQKQARRFEKVVAQADRQQEHLLHLNDELELIKDEQEKSIDELVADKKQRAKKIIENQQKIFQLHRQEMQQAKSEVDELTQVIVQKEQLVAELEELKIAYRKLLESNKSNPSATGKPPIDELSLQDKLKELITEYGYEKRLLSVYESVVTSISLQATDNLKFQKYFISLIMQEVKKDLAKLGTIENSEQLASLVVRKYFDDAIYLFADHIIQLTVKKNIEASQFINFYNGEVAFLPNGKRVDKPDIKDPEGNRWTTSSITQVALRRNQELKTCREKESDVKKIESDLDTKRLEQKQIEGNKIELSEQKGRYSKELELVDLELRAKRAKWMALKEEMQKQSKTSDAEMVAKSKELGELVKQLEVDEANFTKERDKCALELEKIEIRDVQLTKDIKSYTTMLEAESRKLSLMRQSQIPLEEKYQSIIGALARTIIKFRPGA